MKTPSTRFLPANDVGDYLKLFDRDAILSQFARPIRKQV